MKYLHNLLGDSYFFQSLGLHSLRGMMFADDGFGNLLECHPNQVCSFVAYAD